MPNDTQNIPPELAKLLKIIEANSPTEIVWLPTLHKPYQARLRKRGYYRASIVEHEIVDRKTWQAKCIIQATYKESGTVMYARWDYDEWNNDSVDNIEFSTQKPILK